MSRGHEHWWSGQKYSENLVRRIVTMSTQTPEINTASGSTNVGNDNTTDFSDESEKIEDT